MTWGGSAACAACKLRRRSLIAELGLRDDEYGECHDNHGGACKYPPPELLPSVAPLWRVWLDSSRFALGADLSGNLTCDMGNVSVLAAAYDVPVDETFLRRFGVLYDAYKTVQDKKKPKAK